MRWLNIGAQYRVENWEWSLAGIAVAGTVGGLVYHRLRPLRDLKPRATICIGFAVCYAVLLAKLPRILDDSQAMVGLIPPFVAMHAALLVLAGVGQAYVGVHISSLFLLVVTVAAGGLFAGTVVLGEVVAITVWLAFDASIRAGATPRRALERTVAPSLVMFAVTATLLVWVGVPQPVAVFEGITTEGVEVAPSPLAIPFALAALGVWFLAQKLRDRRGSGKTTGSEVGAEADVSERRTVTSAASRSRAVELPARGWRAKVVRGVLRVTRKVGSCGPYCARGLLAARIGRAFSNPARCTD